MSDLRTKDQRMYVIEGQVKIEIDVCPTDEERDAPSIGKCRHAVLQIKENSAGYVVYDRLLSRIVNGVYSHKEDALASAQAYNETLDSPQDMSPNGYALGLIYPDQKGHEDE